MADDQNQIMLSPVGAKTRLLQGFQTVVSTALGLQSPWYLIVQFGSLEGPAYEISAADL